MTGIRPRAEKDGQRRQVPEFPNGVGLSLRSPAATRRGREQAPPLMSEERGVTDVSMAVIPPSATFGLFEPHLRLVAPFARRWSLGPPALQRIYVDPSREMDYDGPTQPHGHFGSHESGTGFDPPAFKAAGGLAMSRVWSRPDG